MPTKKIIDGIKKFRSDVYPKHKPLFGELGSGQSPEVLLITCSDSRISPELVTQALPGELFVIRNAGNLVERSGAPGTAGGGTIEYAVKALKVKHIVVCGHSHCGAMAGVLNPESLTELPAVAAWLADAGPAKVDSEEPTNEEQVRFNVVEQLDNLRSHPSVHEAEANGALELHAWVYDFVHGSIQSYDAKSQQFSELS